MSSTQIKGLENSLLIADPSIEDVGFDRSVIHLSECSTEEGAIGYIINKPTGKRVGEILTAPMFSLLKNIPIYYGGPVGTEHVVFSVYWWGENGQFKYRLRISAEEAVKLKRMPGSILIAHVGHSSWYKGQLENELSERVWITTPVWQETLSVDSTELWGDLLKTISPYHHLLSLTPQQLDKN